MLKFHDWRSRSLETRMQIWDVDAGRVAASKSVQSSCGTWLTCLQLPSALCGERKKPSSWNKQINKWETLLEAAKNASSQLDWRTNPAFVLLLYFHFTADNSPSSLLITLSSVWRLHFLLLVALSQPRPRQLICKVFKPTVWDYTKKPLPPPAPLPSESFGARMAVKLWAWLQFGSPARRRESSWEWRNNASTNLFYTY